MTTLLLLGINEKLFDAVAASIGNSNTFALPARASQISWQTSFGTAPDAVTIQLQVSNDNLSWTTIDSSTSTTGQAKTINTSAIFLRSRINAITGGSEITVTATAKQVEQINTDSPTFTNVTINNDLTVSGDLDLTGTLSDYSTIGGLSANKLLGRVSSDGKAELIDLGTGLSFDGMTLNAGENVAFDYIEFGDSPATQGAIRLSRHLDGSLVDGIWIPNQSGNDTSILKTRTVDDYNTIIIGGFDDWQSLSLQCGIDSIEVNIDLGGDYTPIAGNGVGFFGRGNSSTSGYKKGTLLFGGNLTETDDNQTWFGDTLHPVFIVSGNGSGSDNAGNLSLSAGNSVDGQAGRILISSGIASGIGSNGTIQITSGDRIIHFNEITGAEGIISYTIPAVDNAGGVVLQGGVNDIYAGAQLNVFGGSPDNTAGGLVLISGGICNSINNGANLTLYGGTATSSGNALLNTANVAGSVDSGNVTIQGGNSEDGNAGSITLQVGTPSGSGEQGIISLIGDVLPNNRILFSDGDLNHPSVAEQSVRSLGFYFQYVDGIPVIHTVAPTTIGPADIDLTIELGAAGNTTNGAHSLRITYTTLLGETDGNTNITSCPNVTGNERFNVSDIPLGSSIVTGRKIYMNVAGGNIFYLAATIVNNIDTTAVINISDTDLVSNTPMPIVNTTGFDVATFGYQNVTLNAGDIGLIRESAGLWKITDGGAGLGGIHAGDYKSSDGSSGVSETILLAGLVSLTVKNGLITGHL